MSITLQSVDLQRQTGEERRLKLQWMEMERDGTQPPTDRTDLGGMETELKQWSFEMILEHHGFQQQIKQGRYKQNNQPAP